MSALNLVSIGMSCQTRFQLSHFSSLYPDRNITAKSGPFDWLICPPSSIVALLDKDIPIPTQNDLIVQKDKAYWPEFDVYYWHEFLEQQKPVSKTGIAKSYAGFSEKFQSQISKFKQLPIESTLFVLSNTQFNLETVVYLPEELEKFMFSTAEVDDTHAALNRFFDRKCNFLCVSNVTRADSGFFNQTERLKIPAGRANWKGNVSHWEKVLEQRISQLG